MQQVRSLHFKWLGSVHFVWLAVRQMDEQTTIMLRFYIILKPTSTDSPFKKCNFYPLSQRNNNLFSNSLSYLSSVYRYGFLWEWIKLIVCAYHFYIILCCRCISNHFFFKQCIWRWNVIFIVKFGLTPAFTTYLYCNLRSQN